MLAQKFLGYAFKDHALLETAFTHSSYANVHGCESNERLEFLGNSVLDLVCAEYLYSATKSNEGRLTEMKASAVKEAPLNKIILQSGLIDSLLTCGNVLEAVAKSKVPSDLFEALVGAIYLDGGYDEAKKVILRLLKDDLRGALAHQNDNVNQNHKGILQEFLQAKARSGNLKELGLRYQTADRDGAFFAEVYYQDKLLGCGHGTTKQAAEQAAAKAAYQTLKTN